MNNKYQPIDQTEDEVITVVGGYRVKIGNRLHIVDKQRRCSCGRPGCLAINRVAAYRKAGGQIAPCASSVPTITEKRLCPICGEVIKGSIVSNRWTCTTDRMHYWQWRGERLKTAHARFTMEVSPYTIEILKSFASNAIREEFQEQHRLRYPAEA